MYFRSLLPRGWHIRQDMPVRIPASRSEPLPDIAVVRGDYTDYYNRHPDPPDVALLVGIMRTTAAKDRKLIRVYGAAGIPIYWIVNVPKRQLEVYTGPVQGAYKSVVILKETYNVDLLIAGQVVGRILVGRLLPPGNPVTELRQPGRARVMRFVKE